MAWIVVPFIPSRQQETGIQVTPEDGQENGLKNSGQQWISVIFGRR
ncbi:MAG: hypothetical protein LBU11_10105 [Zoogloeaceae bacterium]|jgi:hypothetical protein|nr:hypothetical protein [Zoogloeaceae bacterium]